MINSIKSCFYITLLNYFYFSHCVEVHFEANDSGFFLKHTRQVPVSPEIANVHASSPATLLRSHTSYNSILSVDRFTVVQTTQPVSIRASYGPFSTKQTVPARYIVPNALDNQTDYLNNTTAALLELQQSNIHLDISAHLVSGNASPEFPVLRVLFHAGADTGAGRMQRQKICVLLHVSSITHAPLKGRCMPEGEDGVCVAEVVIPFSWFQSPISLLAKNTGGYTPLKVPQRYIQLAYSVFEPPTRNPEQCEPKVQVQPLTTFTQLPLIPLTVGFKELRPDNSFTLLLPRQPLYPMSKFHVPVYLHQTLDKAISSFSIKARVRSGIRVVSATPLNDIWNISIEKENSKHTIIRVTALKKDDTVDSSLRHNSSTYNKPINSDHNENHNHKDRIEEIFSWLFEVVGDTKDILDGGKIVWSVTYMYDTAKLKDITLESNALEDNKKKVIAKLEINKDDIQAVMPMAKNWELMNTAVLTGRQVALAMKVFIVSQGGKVAEVTLQSSCHAEDESVIKVSSSCSSVYVDGSEIRGSSNASIIVKYGTYIGLAKFIVWMPEFPLEVYISDFRLSQIKGWRVRDENHYLNKQLRRRRKRSFVSGQINTNYNGYALDKVTCRARYQQSPVEVYARFVAIDQNSGRISYFISRRTGLRVTDLVQPLLRVADPKIATLRGTILQGKTMGRTDIQVLSPITGRVIGAKEIRVGSDKVNLMKLVVRVVSGLQLTITPDNTIENGYIAETAVTHKLTAQYQEGLLDIDLQFSDGSKTPLRDVPVDDYFLLVESLDTEVVAFAPMLASHHPRVIAVGEGNGNLLRITLLLADDCRYRRTAVTNKPVKINTPPLASAMASVEVDFNTENDIINKHEIIQNDGIIGKDKSKYRSSGDLADIIGVPLRDAMHRYKATPHGKQYQYRAPTHSFDEIRFEKSVYHGNMTSMEISMYVLLTAFCFAIVVFIVSCVVYASKFKTFNMENRVESNGHPKSFINGNGYFKDPITLEQTTTNAHDWVWLGRSTMDKSTKTNKLCPNQRFMNCKESRIRITNNPITNCIKDINPNGPMRTARTTSFNMKNSKLLAAYIAGSYYDSQNKENISLKHCDMKLKSKDYRPPVPPHRYIGAGIFNPRHNFCHSTTNQSFKSKTDSVHSSEVICLSKKERNDQADISEKIASNQGLVKSNVNSNEKHNAEKLVEQAIDRRNVFQFDTITLQRTEEDLRNGNIETEVANRNNGKLLEETNGNCKDQLENCFMKLHNRQSPIVQHRTKRATIVGNPMFSSGIDADVMQDESLSLDDLDMDYEQIMHYFDNLKESNA